MNKKGKNKKGKTPNLTPAHVEKSSDKVEETVVTSGNEVVEKTSDVIEKVEERSGSVKEVRVPEIFSEITQPSITKQDDETPKKPKRNRGKKKKGKGDDHNLDDDSQENVILPSTKEMCVESVDVIHTPKEDILTMTCSSSKKEISRSKDLCEQVMIPAADKTLIEKSEVSEIKQESDVLNTQPELEQKEITEQQVKLLKKKNKKKKRNDSERSDKEDISCISAFKKLQDIQDESFELKKEIEADSIGTISIGSDTTKTEKQIPKEILSKETILKDLTDTQDANPLKCEDTLKHLPVGQSKSKKKNKKDKQDVQKIEENIVLSNEGLLMPDSMPVEKETETQTIIEQKNRKTVTEKSEGCKTETTQKHKAKIEQPAEKKHESHVGNVAVDTKLQNQITIDANQSKQFHKVKPESSDIKEIEKLSNIKPEDKKHIEPLVLSNTAETISDKPIDINLLNIPDKASTKKRKKEAKTPDKNITITPDVRLETLKPKFETECKLYDAEVPYIPQKQSINTESTSVKQSDISIKSQEIHSTSIKVETQTNKMQVENQEHILLTPEILEERDTIQIITETTERTQDQDNENKPSKKRRKSPKPPKNVNTISATSNPIVQSPTSPERNLLFEENIIQEGVNIESSNITKLTDIEITSIGADESGSSICDSIPDITYPRSSSQQLPDDNNNNTFIREIFPVLQLSPDPPRQDCVKVSTVDLVVKQKEESKEEKTDLKSKMMEVNQDMEELRLSIERSIAELSLMENQEQVIDKKIEEKLPLKIEISKGETIGDVDTMKEEDKEIKPISNADQTTVEPAKEFHSTEIRRDDNSNKNIISLSTDIKQSLDVVTHGSLECKDIKESETKLINVAKEVPKISSTGTKLPLETSMTIEEKLTETLLKFDTRGGNKPVILAEKVEKMPTVVAKCSLSEETKMVVKEDFINKNVENKPEEIEIESVQIPVCPLRKDQKNKHKKKKGKQDNQMTTTNPVQSSQSTMATQASPLSSSGTSEENKKEEKSADLKESKSESKESNGKAKKQASYTDSVNEEEIYTDVAFEPIENFEDVLTSSVDDVNQTFEMIVEESQPQSTPKIKVIAPDDKKSCVKPSKNLLGHPDIPARSNKRDYKKEKDKIPNDITAKVKIRDSVDIDGKQSKNTQTTTILKYYKMSDNEEFVYKYNFRKVFLQNICHICNKDLSGSRVACCYCNLVFYCNIKHKDEDWPQHQALCFAVSTIGHLKNQKHIYADTKNITGHDYRLIRMQMIVSCERILKRRLVPWEQEALLYPRICAHVPCREWRQMKLSDCQGCGQISFCTEFPDHCPKSHSRWCKSYNLYQKLVAYQLTKGRLEPRLPTKVMQEPYELLDKLNDVLAAMYEEKININDIQYAALTQVATAPLTAAYCHQLCTKKTGTANGYKKSTFTVHVVGAELQFEADALNKWEVFFLHLQPDLQDLKVVLINSNLNPSKLPLDLLGKIKHCENCRQKDRRVIFSFQEKSYADYKCSDDFSLPDIVCAFNPSVQRSSIYNGKDPWPSTINTIIKQKIPFIITAYTMTELQKDCIRIKECAESDYNLISEAKINNFASVRPDRNFISDDEMPLLYKNYCFAVICG